MHLPAVFSELTEELSTTFAGTLTPGQQRTLTAWVAGAVVAGSACQTLVTAALVDALGVGQEHAVRSALREWLYDGAERSAPGRVQVEPAACFAPLLGWVLRHWPSRQLALALDVTTHTDRLTAIVVSVLTQGRAIPVAWHLLPGNQPGAFIDPALHLLTTLAAALPMPPTRSTPRWRVTVAADRGLWSPRLADHLAALGWAPLLRVQRDVSVWLARGQRRPAAQLVAGPGHAWVGRVTVHKQRDRRRIQTVLVVWLLGHAEPWVVFTSLPPTAAGLLWYGLRMWIEAGFRDLKRLGWQWERTRRTDPTRVARHWLVLAVATVWVLLHGTPAASTRPPTTRGTPPISAVQRGRLRLLGLLIGTGRHPTHALVPPVWPDHAALGLHLTRWPHPPYAPGSATAPPVNLPL